ncbi:polysaccharide pyruvyl transferase family protein [Arcobacter peruensis]|uniref:polysaccharide pyruvyl transferase family protein n=1 Tax=Arcobacter peruensis TaxID=2320140 RepID=UPI000F08906E|nr:polysaccharide pyruvyl transferase family protein [Arcobacter peruensis]
MKKIRVLQLASFEGNIGDNANMSGTRKKLSQNLKNYDLEFTNLEIREFYWKKRFFDDDFVSYVNEFDLFLVGGGNYFELWVENSSTGTSIDISVEKLKAINTPTVFYALGCDEGQGIGKGCLDKFRAFLDYVLSNKEQFLVSVRNDGSFNTIKKNLGEEYSNRIHRVADGGFFVDIKDTSHPEIELENRNIGINIAGDMLDGRYSNISYEEFTKKFSNMLKNIMDKDEKVNLVLFPHIYKDIATISDFVHSFPDDFARKRITVSPYLHGEKSSEYIFDLYSKCDLILGNRFHSNVCAIGLGVPSIGIVNYPQVKYLYEELSLKENFVDINNNDNFEKKFTELIEYSLNNKKEISDNYKFITKNLEDELNIFHSEIKKLLENNGN